MKKYLMLIAAAMLAGAARAATETVDGMTYTYTVSGGAATITKAEGDNKSVTIPSTLGGATVTTLKGGVFMNNTTVMKVTIPETVTTMTYQYVSGIGDSSPFMGCIALTTCNIPSGVKTIPRQCFYECCNLKHISLPQELISIGSDAFYNCSALKAIDLPNGLTGIGYGAFRGCRALMAVDIPDTVTSVDGECFSTCNNLKSVHLPTGLTALSRYLFCNCTALVSVNIPAGVTSINEGAFWGCSALKELTLPVCLASVGSYAFYDIGRIVFQGKPPVGLSSAYIETVVYPKEYGAQWQAYFAIANTGGYVNPNKPVVTIVSSGVRPNAPTILDVVYKVTSTKPTVKVRTLAFEDGERSLAKVTRPETFVADTNGVATAGNIGDAIAANVEHTLSWQVSSDFKTDLANMKFEVLAVEDDILPLEFITIPANGSNKAMELSWNLMTESQVFDALLWLYAAKTEGLTLTSGVLKNGTTQLASGTGLYRGQYSSSYDGVGYCFSKMGYSVLTGTDLTYANDMTRMGLSPSGIRQYAYRWIEGK